MVLRLKWRFKKTKTKKLFCSYRLFYLLMRKSSILKRFFPPRTTFFQKSQYTPSTNDFLFAIDEIINFNEICSPRELLFFFKNRNICHLVRTFLFGTDQIIHFIKTSFVKKSSNPIIKRFFFFKTPLVFFSRTDWMTTAKTTTTKTEYPETEKKPIAKKKVGIVSYEKTQNKKSKFM